MKLIVKKLIPFIAALLLLVICGAISKAQTAGYCEGNCQEALLTKISAGSGNPDGIPLD